MSSSLIREKQLDALVVSRFAGDTQGVLLQELHEPSNPLSEEDTITLKNAKEFLNSAKIGCASASEFAITGRPASNFRDIDNTDICLQVLDISPKAPGNEFYKAVDKILRAIDACLEGRIRDMAFEETADVKQTLQFFKDIIQKYGAKSCTYC